MTYEQEAQMVAALSSNVSAQQTISLQAIREKFAQTDADASGGLSLEEFSAGAPKGIQGLEIASEDLFSQFDSDSDGSLSESEFTTALENAPPPPPPPPPQGLLSGDTSVQLQELFSNIDADADGSISFEEFEAGAPEDAPDNQEDLFNALDTDGDGSLNEEELISGLPQGKSGAAGGPPPGGPPPSSSANTDEESSYDPLDTNQDGIVSATELAASEDETSSGDSTTVADTLSVLISAQAA